MQSSIGHSLIFSCVCKYLRQWLHILIKSVSMLHTEKICNNAPKKNTLQVIRQTNKKQKFNSLLLNFEDGLTYIYRGNDLFEIEK